MLAQQTLQTLRRLKLTGMADALEQQIAQPQTHALSFEERIGLLIDRELTSRDNRRLTRLLRAAKLKHPACVEDINYRHSRGLQRAPMASLVTSDWVRQRQSLLIVGPTGCGKTWLACALGNAACRQGLSVLYLRATRLLDDLRIAHADGSYTKKLAYLAKLDLLILDDWGLQKLTRAQAQDLLEVVDDRHGARSLLITSQLPIEHWHDTLGDPTLADAILDRVCHSSHKLLLTGESMRKNTTKTDKNLDPS
ncbi:MAG: IS21-like element helper ATPase IstB [Pseudomonadota bacterium]